LRRSYLEEGGEGGGWGEREVGGVEDRCWWRFDDWLGKYKIGKIAEWREVFGEE